MLGPLDDAAIPRMRHGFPPIFHAFFHQGRVGSIMSNLVEIVVCQEVPDVTIEKAKNSAEEQLAGWGMPLSAEQVP